jgi:hypothetical protein
VFRPADGQPPGSVEIVTLSIYPVQEGGAPLWQETQNVAPDERGRYTLLLGATLPDGIPPAVFGSGSAQWLGTRFERPGEVEGPRAVLAQSSQSGSSVPVPAPQRSPPMRQVFAVPAVIVLVR